MANFGNDAGTVASGDGTHAQRYCRITAFAD